MSLAAGHFDAGRFAEAERSCLEVLSSDPRFADALYLLGMTAYRTQRYELAVRMMVRAISANGQEPRYYFSLGNALQMLGRYGEAAACFEEAIRLCPAYPDAHYNLGNALQAQGKLEAAADVFARALELDPGSSHVLNNLGILLYRQGKLEEAASKLAAAVAVSPNSVSAHINLATVLTALGTAFHARGRLDDALRCFVRAVELEPGNSERCTNLGVVQEAKGMREEAIASYRRALVLDPSSLHAHTCLGIALEALGETDEAIACYEEALRIDVDCVHAHTSLGVALRSKGEIDAALASYHRALALDPENTDALWNLSLTELLVGNFGAGWRHFEARWKRKNAPLKFGAPQWMGEPLYGASILLYGEQGMGDMIQFLRYVPMVQGAGGKVVLGLPAAMHRLVNPSLGVAVCAIPSEDLPAFSFHCPFMSLPLALGTTIETIPAGVPYVSVPARALEAAAAQEWPQEGLRVGLVWAGNPAHPRDRFRSMALQELEPLFDLEGVHFYSLQMGEASEQLAAFLGRIADLTFGIEDAADTAARILQLDLVVCVDTAVAHLAGALGKRVWLMVPFAPDWRWLLGREDSPWYPTMRLFRQEKAGEWAGVVGRVRASLVGLRSL